MSCNFRMPSGMPHHRNVELATFDVFSQAECDAIVGELQRAAQNAATVYGVASQGKIEEQMRRTKQLVPSEGTREIVQRKLAALREPLAERFAIPLETFEEPQFLRYETGDYFVMHQDGNTPLTRDDSRHRHVSAIIFLSDAARDHAGGDLVFQAGYEQRFARTVAPSERGTLVAFRSEQSHEVTAVTRGERYTVVTWYR